MPCLQITTRGIECTAFAHGLLEASFTCLARTEAHARLHLRPHLRLRPHSPPPLAHSFHPPPILLKPLPQIDLGLLPLLAVLEPVEVILDTVVLAPLFQLRLLLLCFFQACGACTSAAGHGYETIFVRYGAGVFEERGACALEGGELREVGVYAGLEGGGGRVEEVEVGFIAWGWVSMYVS